MKDTANYKTFEAVFEKEKVSISQMLSKELLSNMKLHVSKNEIMRSLILRLDSFVATQKRQTEYDIYFSVPLNWFHHLKRALGLRYKEKKLSKRVTFEEKFIFPDMPFPPEGKYTYIKQNTINH